MSSKDLKNVLETTQQSQGNIEYESLAAGGPRIKYTYERQGSLKDFFNAHPECKARYAELANALADHVLMMEQRGATPLLPDGNPGGNVSARLHVGDVHVIIVSRSSKKAGVRGDINNDFVIVQSFDHDKWSCQYYSQSEDIRPTSDSPMHYTVLNAQKWLTWDIYPNYILHGHAFETEEEANKLGFPISTEETLFSTPEDTQALLILFEQYPYPKNNIFIRKAHGFMLLAQDYNEAEKVFMDKMNPHLQQ